MSIKYIFSINTGRCGSDYLTELFSMAANTISLHEGFPIMNGAPMQQFNDGNPEALHQLMPLKVKQILKQSQHSKKVYCETNHSFIKGWGYLLPDTYIPQQEIGVVILHREVEKIIHSLLRVHEVPGISEWSRTWYLLPQATRNFNHPPDKANLYELCRWYIEETNLRAEDYKQKFPKITYFECDLEQLNHYDFVLRMFHGFGLTSTSGLRSACGKTINMRHEWPTISLDDIFAPTRYPNADYLEPSQRDSLVQDMIRYLRDRHPDTIAAIKPDLAMGGTILPAIAKLVAHAEDELEHVFQYQLKFTETEQILIAECIRCLSPYDVAFVVFRRKPEPGIAYTYDFNLAFDMKDIVRRLGIIGFFQMLWMMLIGIWGKDYTHRKNN